MKTLIDGLLRYSRVTTQAQRLEEMEARSALDGRWPISAGPSRRRGRW